MPFCQIAAKVTNPRMHEYPKTFSTWGDHLCKRRLDLGLTKVQAAERIGTNVDSIRQWEHNTATPTMIFRPAIIEFLGYCPEADATNFPAAVRLLRVKAGFSVSSLAIKLGVSGSSIRRWEQGINRPLPPTDQPLKTLFAENEISMQGDFAGRTTGRPRKCPTY